MGLWTRLKLIFNVKTSTALDQAEDPREVMDYAYYQQEEFLRKVKQGLVEVSTAKHQLARQVQKQKAHIPQLDDQAQRAIDANRLQLPLGHEGGSQSQYGPLILRWRRQLRTKDLY